MNNKINNEINTILNNINDEWQEINICMKNKGYSAGSTTFIDIPIIRVDVKYKDGRRGRKNIEIKG